MAPRRSSPLAVVLAGGLVAGTFDIVYACVFWAVKADVPVRRIFQSVAAGLLGKASFEGGAATAALGLGLHYFIACSMAVAYYLVARRVPPSPRAPGAVRCRIWTPALRDHELHRIARLVAGGGGAKDPLWVGLSIVVHMLLIGVPIALFVRAALRDAPMLRPVRG